MDDIEERLPSFSHQKKARKLSRNKKYFGYLMEQGTGKSKTLIDDASLQFKLERINALMITAPNGVQDGWFLEHLPTHLPKWVDYRVFVFDKTGSVKGRKKWEHMMSPSFTGLRIFIFHFEAITNKSRPAYKMACEFLKKNKVMWAIDESHRIKGNDSSVTKTIMGIRFLAVIRRILTGTMVSEGPLDVYPQMAFLHPSILGIDSFSAFKCRYAEIEASDSRMMHIVGKRLEAKYGKDRAGKMVEHISIVAKDENGRAIYKNLDELRSKIDPYSYRCLKEDCTDLPPKLYEKRYVSLTSQQRALYSAVEEEYEASYLGEDMTADMAMTRMTRLQQITGGFFTADSGSVIAIEGGNPKLEELLEYTEEVTGKVIIWAAYVEELRAIAAALRDIYGTQSTARYWGEIDKTRRAAGKKAFTDKNHECRFFVANTETGGTGLDGLQVANNMYYYSNNFKLIARLQSEDRGHRIGLSGSLTITDAVAKDSRDEFIVASLRARKDVADIINGDPNKKWI